eukprot:GHUV01051248.1.p1 GENE.GHUV01051248.1~~GHUV01051248.1.p1  ORF type:complete len:153 (+),score=19.94 GHUV01051248.1:174-632(+)
MHDPRPQHHIQDHDTIATTHTHTCHNSTTRVLPVVTEQQLHLVAEACCCHTCSSFSQLLLTQGQTSHPAYNQAGQPPPRHGQKEVVELVYSTVQLTCAHRELALVGSDSATIHFQQTPLVRPVYLMAMHAYYAKWHMNNVGAPGGANSLISL